METFPPYRIPEPCGWDVDLTVGRQPLQNHWYEWIGQHSLGSSVLDVGAGMCEGLKILRNHGGKPVVGFEVDTRLAGYDPLLLTGVALSDIPDRSFDVVCAVDVIEHVVQDLDFFRNLMRISVSRVYVTTPDFQVSQCRNAHHCREYTFNEFERFFEPDELFTEEGALVGTWWKDNASIHHQ